MPPTERLLFCADNLFDPIQYPLHVVSGQEEATGFEAYHVGTWRRQAGDAWRPTTANADRWIRSLCGQLRGADFFAIDRESNHLDRTTFPYTGKRFILEISGDDFAADVQTVADMTAPPVVGGPASQANGALTDEGAWVKTFALEASYAWRVTCKAQGASLTPSISGLWVGKAWAPSDFVLFKPTQDKTYRAQPQQTESPYGWVGHMRSVPKRQGALVIKPGTEADYDAIEHQVLGLFLRGVPAWIIHDKDDGTRDAFLARFPGGELDWGQKLDWGLRGIVIPFEEEQPAL